MSNEAKTGYDLAVLQNVHEVGSRRFVTLPEYGLVEVPYSPAKPDRVQEARRFSEVKSLCDYTKAFGSSPHAFADWRKGKIAVTLDYHTGSNPEDDATHCAHKATFLAQHSEPWAAWRRAHDNQKSQADFARFLEERAHEIIEPDAATVIETEMNLDAVKKVSFKSAVRLTDGFRQFQYLEEDQTKGGIRVPEKMKIRVPIYEGMEPDTIECRMRFRISEGALRMWITFDNLADIERLAFDRCVQAFGVDCPEVPLYRALLD